MTLPQATTLGASRLRVADLDAIASFYERVVGLRILERQNGSARMGADGGPPVLELVAAPDAPVRPAFSSGLYHNAFLVPDRPELARALRRIAGAGWRLTGVADHLVSEALYLRDPEGNGVEIYRDRPRDEWPREPDGSIRMASDPIDLDELLTELPAGAAEPGPGDVAAGTRLGHVHLQAGDLRATGDFYELGLGLDVMVRWLPGALFMSAGGYHHHLGLNDWETRGAPKPPPGALGLDVFEVVLPDAAERDGAAARLSDAGHSVEPAGDDALVRDPGGVGVLLRAA